MFQHDSALSKIHNEIFLSEFGVEELFWPEGSLDLNQLQELWDELEADIEPGDVGR